MPVATRVLLAPPDRWDEARLLEAARALPEPRGAVRPGDEMAGLVVVGVEPKPGATADRVTAFEIQPTPRARGGRLLDVAILLDASESMGLPWSARHTRFEAAREALRHFLQDPGRHLRLVSLFIYARSAQLVAGPVASSRVELPELAPRGRSMTGTALNEALAYLAQHASPECGQAVLFLSDGAGEAAELERASARAARLHVPVHTLLFAPDDDPAFARVAQATGGSSQRATLPPSFTLVFEPPPEEAPP